MAEKRETRSAAAVKEMSEPYSGFAEIYDQLMAGVDYKSWADYIEALMSNRDKKAESVLDLACGTGSSSIPFAKKGYLTAGVDISIDMLAKAREKSKKAGLDIVFYQEDLRSLNLPDKYELAVLFQDGLNYLLKEEDLLAAFKSIHNALKADGIFIFDLTRSALRYSEEGGQFHWADTEDFTLIYESSYLQSKALWEINLTAFYLAQDGLYRKFQETHREKDYPPDTVERLLEQAGFTVTGLHPSFSLEPARGYEQKLTFVAEKL